jgi:hypothetical protein
LILRHISSQESNTGTASFMWPSSWILTLGPNNTVSEVSFLAFLEEPECSHIFFAATTLILSIKLYETPITDTIDIRGIKEALDGHFLL